MENKAIVIGCRYNPYTDKKTGAFVDCYQLFVVFPLFDKNGVFCGYQWPVDYVNNTSYKSRPLKVSREEFDSWGIPCNEMVYKTVDCFYNQYGSLVKVSPVIEK